MPISIYLDPPVLTGTPSADEYVNLQAILRLSCVATGNDIPSITWYKDGVVVTQDATHTITDTQQLPDQITSTLKVNPVSMATEGVYNCSASNSLGDDSFVTNVHVLCKFFVLFKKNHCETLRDC